ncbi:MAG: SpoIIE family protein phosphatase [Anaerolineae bacterium]|nr:SpoIIE family protein phosphatase [Anaerolineae bacterium]
MSDQSAVNNLSSEHLLTLYEITRTMNSSLDFDDVLNRAMDSVMQVTKAERGVLMIADSTTGQLQIRVARNVSGETLANEDAYSTTVVNQVVETRTSLLTNNAMFDNRYVPGQSIIMRGLRAILCAPMLVKDRLVGVVYVDTSMRSGNFSEADRNLLSAVAGQAGIAIENARLYAVAVEKGRIERELQMGREMQRALMPQEMPVLEGYELAAIWRAAREMAGDFYDAFHLGEDRLGVVIADVSDKGAAAALFMAVSRSFIRSYAHAGLSPVDTLRATNDLILDDADSGMFVTAYHSIFDRNGICYNVNAGHNPPLYYQHAKRKASFMPRGGRAIGWFADNPVKEVILELSPGDTLVYYTDGVTEAEDEESRFYSDARLIRAVMACAGESAAGVRDYIVRDVEQFCGNVPLFDDLTLLVVKYTG